MPSAHFIASSRAQHKDSLSSNFTNVPRRLESALHWHRYCFGQGIPWPQIYLSFTFDDLKDYRRVVYEALLKSGHYLNAREGYVAKDRRWISLPDF